MHPCHVRATVQDQLRLLRIIPTEFTTGKESDFDEPLTFEIYSIDEWFDDAFVGKLPVRRKKCKFEFDRFGQRSKRQHQSDGSDKAGGCFEHVSAPDCEALRFRLSPA